MRDESASPPDQPGEDRYVGATFASRYKILRKVAEGAQARVYAARHTLIGRQVAVKMLLPVLAADRELVKRFLNEGRAAGTLGHPNVVEFLDMGVAPDGAPYLVMELLEGSSLAYEIYRTGPLPVGRAAYIAAQIASAVAVANERGIVHRDLKPENVVLVERNERPDHVKVLDFGISKVAGMGTMVGTAKGQFLGTPGFMAPEQLEDPGGVDARADVYALGATIYDMLAGSPPFADVEFPKVLRLIAEEKPRPLDQIRNDLPPGLVAVVERAMSKAPADRYQTMGELEQELMAYAVEPTRRKSKPTPNVPFGRPPLDTPSADLLPSGPRLLALPGGAAARDTATHAHLTPEAISWAHRAEAGTPMQRPGGTTSAFSRRPKASPRPPSYVLPVLLAAVGVALAGAAFLRWNASRQNDLARGAEPSAGVSAEPAPSALPEPRPSRAQADDAPSAPSPSAPALARARTASHPPSHPPPRLLPPARTAPPPAAPSDTCNPPFYYEGTKKLFKPGCL